jgi:hypothetical protein
VTATLVIPCKKKPSNRRRIAIPLGAAADYPHIQPGDTRIIRLANVSLTDEGCRLLTEEAADRGMVTPDESHLLDDLADWEDAELVIVAVGNDAFGGGRRCWEKRYDLDKNPLHKGDFPTSDKKECCPE